MILLQGAGEGGSKDILGEYFIEDELGDVLVFLNFCVLG